VFTLYIGPHEGARYTCQILMKIEFSRQVFEKQQKTKYHENPSSVSLVVACGKTDRHMTKPKVVFRNFANAPKTC